MPNYLLLLSLGIGFALLLTPISRRLAFVVGAIDKPGRRHVHLVPTPRFGGAALLPALGLTILAVAMLDRFAGGAMRLESAKLAALAIGALMVTTVGAIDDVRPLRPIIKLMVEVAAASIAVYGGYRITSLSGIHLELLSFPLSVLFIVTAINAVNMIDGLDGLAVGLCLSIAATLFFLCSSSGQIGAAMIMAALCGTLIGFLPYNFHPARIFLGDSGALLLGFMLGTGAISTSHKMAGAVAIAAPFLALGLPLAELMLTALRRTLRAVHVVRLDDKVSRYDFLFLGRPALFSADRDHIHHRLLAFGISHRTTVLLLYGVSVAVCAVAFVIASHEDMHQGPLLAVLMVAAVIGVRGLGYRELRPFRSGLLLPLFDLPSMNRKIVQPLLDAGFILASYAIAFLIAGGPVGGTSSFVISMLIVATTQMIALMAGGLYRRSYRRAGMDDILALGKTLALAIGAGYVASLMAPTLRPQLGVLLIDAYLLATMVIGARISFRLLDHLFERRRPDALRVLIYGAGRAGAVALREIRSNTGLAMTAVGFLDDDPRRSGSMLNGVAIHPSENLSNMIREDEFDAVVLASNKIKMVREQILTEQCKHAGLRVVRFEINWQGAVFINSSAPPAMLRRTASVIRIHGAGMRN
jgi:UDP-GlcNAc:undecaprenyl-phosphate/decaprenyl-phosphate GlcNAc-1-phosphate transferase